MEYRAQLFRSAYLDSCIFWRNAHHNAHSPAERYHAARKLALHQLKLLELRQTIRQSTHQP